MTAFIDYAMLPTAFDALTAKKIPVLVAGEAPSGGKTSSADLAFFDPSGHVNEIYETTSAAGHRQRRRQAERPLDRAQGLQPHHGRVRAPASRSGRSCAPTARSPRSTSRLPTSTSCPRPCAAALVSNPDVNVIMVPVDSFVPPVMQAVKTAGKDIKVVSTGGDLANMQNVKAGTQAGDLGTPVIYTGWQYANAPLPAPRGRHRHPGHGARRTATSTRRTSAPRPSRRRPTSPTRGTATTRTRRRYKTAWGIS